MLDYSEFETIFSIDGIIKGVSYNNVKHSKLYATVDKLQEYFFRAKGLLIIIQTNNDKSGIGNHIGNRIAALISKDTEIILISENEKKEVDIGLVSFKIIFTGL